MLPSDHSHILLVDDEPDLLSNLAEVLSSSFSEMRVSTASSAEAALDVLFDNPTQLIITDFRLPEMDGIELTKNVREVSPGTSSILITAFGNQATREKAQNLGCLAYLEKPFDVDLLIGCVEQAITTESSSPSEQLIPIRDTLVNALQSPNPQALNVIVGESSGLVVIRNHKIAHARFRAECGKPALISLLRHQFAVIRPLNLRQTVAPSIQIDLAELLKIMERVSAVQATPYQTRQQRHQQALRPSPQISKSATLGASATNIAALVNKGIESFKQHNFQEAERFWLAAVEIDPNCEPAKRNLTILSAIRSRL